MSKYWEKLTCLKTLLMIFNGVLWLVGTFLLFIGIWLRIELRDYVDVNVESNWIALLALASLGALLTLIATFACRCTTRGHPALLYVYGAVLAVIILLTVGVVMSIFAYRTDLNKRFDHDLNETMSVYGQDAKKTSYIDVIQSTLFCCGSRSYTDWSCMYTPKEIPKSCCKKYEAFEGEAHDEQSSQPTCDVNDVDQIYTEGCYTRVLDLINHNIVLVTILAACVTCFPFIGILLSCSLASHINKIKYEQVA